ncbi:MAG: hypothetical protein IID38_11515 [Planctomycetes bacterium]|nr:hypothetical protein [Planctomycetota bacterium]
MDLYSFVAPVAIFLILTPSLARLFGTHNMGLFGALVIAWFAGRKILAGLWAITFIVIVFRVPLLPQGSTSLGNGIGQTLDSLANLALTSSYFWAMYAAIAVATEDGFEIHIPGFVDSLQALAFGVAVFPVGREFIILLALWMLLLRANTGVARSLIALALLAAGLMLTRYASRNFQDPQAGLQMVGAGALVTATLIQLLGARHGAGVSTDPAAGDHPDESLPGDIL